MNQCHINLQWPFIPNCYVWSPARKELSAGELLHEPELILLTVFLDFRKGLRRQVTVSCVGLFFFFFLTSSYQLCKSSVSSGFPSFRKDFTRGVSEQKLPYTPLL